MWSMIWPILIVVAANAAYHLATKSTPDAVNTFASLFITYLTAAVCSLLLFFCTAGQKNLWAELGKTNWTAYVLGAAVVGLEFGFVCIYRAGWKISIAQLVASSALTCVLLIIGLCFYREALSVRQIVGLCLAGAGLILLSK